MSEQAVPAPKRAIPGGEQPSAWKHLVPIARLLIDRGHQPLWERDREKSGFHPRPDGWVCELRGSFTPADRDAVNATFELPENISWLGLVIRDSANWTDMYGLAVAPDF